VLVLQNLGVDAYPIWHYAVLIGVDAERGQAILRSGTRERQVMSWSRFEASWSRAGRWAVTVLAPGTLPSRPEVARYLEAVAGLEAADRKDEAALALAAALEQWPEQPLVRLALGNNAYVRRDLAGAIAAYRDGLGLSPDDVVLRNNLAQALLDKGCGAAALAEARHAGVLARGSVLEGEVRATMEAATLAEGRGRDAPGCAAPAIGNTTVQPLSSTDGSAACSTHR
jgi:tetratricopeptide (TPR) repeat protein